MCCKIKKMFKKLTKKINQFPKNIKNTSNNTYIIYIFGGGLQKSIV